METEEEKKVVAPGDTRNKPGSDLKPHNKDNTKNKNDKAQTRKKFSSIEEAAEHFRINKLYINPAKMVPYYDNEGLTFHPEIHLYDKDTGKPKLTSLKKLHRNPVIRNIEAREEALRQKEEEKVLRQHAKNKALNEAEEETIMRMQAGHLASGVTAIYMGIGKALIGDHFGGSKQQQHDVNLAFKNYLNSKDIEECSPGVLLLLIVGGHAVSQSANPAPDRLLARGARKVKGWIAGIAYRFKRKKVKSEIIKEGENNGKS